MLLILMLLSSCSAPNFVIFKQKMEFKGDLNKEYAYKVATYVATKLNFNIVRENPYKTLAIVKEIKIKTEDNYKVKASEKIENSKELFLIIGLSDEGYIIKSIIKKDIISIGKIGRGKNFKDIKDDEIESSEMKYESVKDDSEEESEILKFIESITEILKVRKDVQKLNESQLAEEDKKLISIEGE